MNANTEAGKLYGGMVDYVINASGTTRHYTPAVEDAPRFPGDVAVMCGRTITAAHIVKSTKLDPHGVTSRLTTCRNCARKAIAPNLVTRERAAELDAAAAEQALARLDAASAEADQVLAELAPVIAEAEAVAEQLAERAGVAVVTQDDFAALTPGSIVAGPMHVLYRLTVFVPASPATGPAIWWATMAGARGAGDATRVSLANFRELGWYVVELAERPTEATPVGAQVVERVGYDIQASNNGGESWSRMGGYSYMGYAHVHQVAEEMRANSPVGYTYRVIEKRETWFVSVPPSEAWVEQSAEQPAPRGAEAGDTLVHPRPAAGPARAVDIDLTALRDRYAPAEQPAPVEAGPSPVDASTAPALPQVDDAAPLGRGDLVTYNGIRYVIIRADSMAELARGEGQVELFHGDALPERIRSGERGHWVEASACTRRLVLEWGVRHRDPVTGALEVVGPHAGRAFAEHAVEVAVALGERSAELVARIPGGEWAPAPMRTPEQREAEAAAFLAALD